MNKTILRGAILTVLTLFGGIAIGLFAGEGRNFWNPSRGCGFHEVKSSLKIIPRDIRIETIQSMKRNRHESI